MNKYSIDTENFSIKPGKKYIVYAVWIYLRYIWYCICDEDKKAPFISFPEWANDLYFYGELVDGNSSDINAIIFKKYKELMELEFPNFSISEIAQIGDEEWLICPKCIDAWQSTNDKDALVKCPKYKILFRQI